MSKDNNYVKDLEINLLNLENEWLEQPGLYAKYGDLLAEAREELAYAKEKVKTVRSELTLEAKEGGKELLGVAATSDATEAWYRTQDEFKDARAEEIKCQSKVNSFEVAVFAFQQRKSALENLVQLWRGSYYSEPKDEDMDEVKAQRASATQKKKLNARKRSK